MKTLVAYSSGHGNTKLIAEKIAEKLKCQIVSLDEVNVNEIDLKNIDTVLIGSGVYGGKFSKSVTEFAESLNSRKFSAENRLRTAFFVTWLGRGKSNLTAVDHCRNLIHSEWIIDNDDVLSCLGESFKFIRRGHPDEKDLQKAEQWAVKLVSES